MSTKKVSLTQGAVFKALFLFSLSMIVTNTVSILFHAADGAVLSFLAQGLPWQQLVRAAL